MKKEKKISDIISLANELIDKGAYSISNHANLRQGQRIFTTGDILNVITYGYHEKQKDQYKTEFSNWTYAIRGPTLDHDPARVCIAFDEDKSFVVVTVIRLEEL